MARNRMRYTGGINRELAQAFLRETGTKGVLITSLEYLSEGPPPKISLLARLVSTGDPPVILWMKSLGMSGDDHPGILGLGLIWTPEEILRRAVGTALDSLALSVPAGMDRVAVRSVRGGKFRPKRFFRFPELAFGGDRPVTVAVVPFMNIGTRKNAGSLMELHFVDRLAQVWNVRVIEPGVIREEMLRLRIIMQGGLSDPQAGLLFSRLESDFLLSGLVAEYQDYEGGTGGQAKVTFSVQVFDMKSRRVVWSSRSYNRGDDGVFFFDVGEVKTAAAIASEMAWAVIERMISEKR
jgi:TolB-like protein